MATGFDEHGKWKFSFIPEFSDCIARIASCWARIEYDVSATIWALADVRPALGACITAQIYTFNGRLNALLALAKMRRVDDKIISRINRFAENSRSGQDKRNRTVHDLWMQDNGNPGNMGRLRITAEKKLAFKIQSVMFPEIKKDLETIEDLSTEFSAIRDVIDAALPTLPEIPHQELHPIIETPLDR